MLAQVSLVKSGFVQCVVEGDNAIVWHSLFGNPQIVSSATLELIDLFSTPRTLDNLRDSFDIDAGVEESVRTLVAAGLLVEEGVDERALLDPVDVEHEKEIQSGKKIEYLELIMSEACNFRCTYCIHFNNLETSDRLDNTKKLMTFETAKRIVDEFLRILRSHGKSIAEINFGGGEPLLVWKVIDQVLEYCSSEYGTDFDFIYTINTNASLITPEIAATLKRYKVQVAVSLDGLKQGNDQVRVTNSGKGTFDLIMVGFQSLKQQGYPTDGFAVTVNERNFSELSPALIDWAEAQGMTEVRIDIDVIDMLDIPLEEIVQRLMEVRRYAQSKGIDIPGFWARPVENLNTSTLHDHVGFCGAVKGNSVCVSPSGNIYACGYSTTQLGTIDQIDFFTKKGGKYYDFVKARLTGAMEMCKGCMIEGQCGGGCNITLEFARATQTSKIERMCDFYRLMTKELLFELLRQNVPASA